MLLAAEQLSSDSQLLSLDFFIPLRPGIILLLLYPVDDELDL